MNANKKVRFEELYPLIQETIGNGDTVSFCAFGVSMLPFIRNGKDLVTLGPVLQKLAVNDIIFYRRKSGQFVLHRIVKIYPDGSFGLCGDNQYHIENEITQEQVIAKLVGLNRKGKEISLTSPLVRVWCFFLPFRRFFLNAERAFAYRIKKLLKK